MAQAGPASDTKASPSSPQEERFTIITRGNSFHLSRAQVEYDSPNYFSAAFLQHDFAEARSKVLYTDRNPQLFALIVEHLSGYKILPLAEKALPQTMNAELAHANLLADAEYFQLDQLGDQVRSAISAHSTLNDQGVAASSEPPTSTSYPPHNLKKYLHWCGLRGSALDRIHNALSAYGFSSARALLFYEPEKLVHILGVSYVEAALIAGGRDWSDWVKEARKY